MRIVCLMYVNGHLVDEMDILQGTQGNAKDLYQTSGFLGSQFLTVGISLGLNGMFPHFCWECCLDMLHTSRIAHIFS